MLNFYTETHTLCAFLHRLVISITNLVYCQSHMLLDFY